jgi:rRNA maturation RNase YbeY
VSKELSLRNRQGARKVDLRLLRRVISNCLEELVAVSGFDLGIQLVDSTEMARINEGYLGHAGSTDVITFNYGDAPARSASGDTRVRGLKPPKRGSSHFIRGDIYVCVDEAILQAKEFDTSWQEELVRYVVHGILHLLGYDDRTRQLRKPMKRIEESIVAELVRRFPLRSLQVRNARGNG